MSLKEHLADAISAGRKGEVARILCQWRASARTVGVTAPDDLIVILQLIESSGSTDTEMEGIFAVADCWDNLKVEQKDAVVERLLAIIVAREGDEVGRSMMIDFLGRLARDRLDVLNCFKAGALRSFENPSTDIEGWLSGLAHFARGPTSLAESARSFLGSLRNKSAVNNRGEIVASIEELLTSTEQAIPADLLADHDRREQIWSEALAAADTRKAAMILAIESSFGDSNLVASRMAEALRVPSLLNSPELGQIVVILLQEWRGIDEEIRRALLEQFVEVFAQLKDESAIYGIAEIVADESDVDTALITLRKLRASMPVARVVLVETYLKLARRAAPPGQERQIRSLIQNDLISMKDDPNTSVQEAVASALQVLSQQG